MKVRSVNLEDKKQWMKLRMLLWPNVGKFIHETEIESMLSMPEKFSVFVAADESNEVYGFIEVSIREDIDEGCVIKNIGYIEGWYVIQEKRGEGIGSALMETAEKWILRKGLNVIGSDTGPDNIESQRVYRSLGFNEIDRAVHYRKKL